MDGIPLLPFTCCNSNNFIGPSTTGTSQRWLSPAYAGALSRALSLPFLDSTERSDRGTVTFLKPFTCVAKIHCRLRDLKPCPCFNQQ